MKKTLLMQQLYLYGVHVILSYGCGQSEYQSEAGECCPMCGLGMVVHIDCHGDYSTACKPCSTGRTFMDQPNGLKQCFPCKSCDSQKGLYVWSSCTVMRNTQCKVMEGYYCTEFLGGECSSALKHRQCEPGETIKTPGSEKSDTVCEACPSGFYSPLGINCTRWTDCSVRDEVQQREGSAVEDVQCVSKASRHRYCIIPAAASALAVLLYTVFSPNQAYQQGNDGGPTDVEFKNPVPETGQGTVPAASSNSPEEHTDPKSANL
uniref:Si:ch211-261n11.8 n=1 Tax=Astyanax mexicanus TaxID=7994 RepID=W5L5T8_ASTMX